VEELAQLAFLTITVASKDRNFTIFKPIYKIKWHKIIILKFDGGKKYDLYRRKIFKF